MKILGVTLAVIGCLLCDSRVAAQTTQSMLPGAPADNIVNANFQLTADTNVSADVANQFTLGGAGGLPTGTGQTSPLLNDLFGNPAPGQTNPFDQLVNSLFTNTGTTGTGTNTGTVANQLPATQAPPVIPTNTGATGTQTGTGTGSTNGTDMLIPGLSATDFGNMLTGGGGSVFPVNDTGFPTAPATSAGTGSGIGSLLDNTIAGTGMMNNPTGGIPPLPPTGTGLPGTGLGGAQTDLGNLLGSLGGGGGGPMGMFGQSGSPNPGIPTLPTNPNPKPPQRPRQNPMMTMLMLNAMTGGEMGEGMEMMIPMMLMQQMQQNRRPTAGAGPGAGSGYNPFGNLGGFNNPQTPSGAGPSPGMGSNSVFGNLAGGGGGPNLLGGGGGMPLDPMAGMTQGPMDPTGGVPTGPAAGSGGSDIVSLLLGGNPGPATSGMGSTSPLGTAPAGTQGSASGFDSLLNSIISPTGTGGTGGATGTAGMSPLTTLLG